MQEKEYCTIHGWNCNRWWKKPIWWWHIYWRGFHFCYLLCVFKENQWCTQQVFSPVMKTRKCCKIHRFCGHANKDNRDKEMNILWTHCFKLRILSKVKLILNSIWKYRQKKLKWILTRNFYLLLWELLCEFLFLTLTSDEVIPAICWHLL